MRQKKIILPLFTLAFLFVLMSSMVQAEVVIVVNNSVNTDNLGLKDIKKIFLGKKMYWQDNTKITLFILAKSPIHKDFVKKYLGRSEQQFVNFWKQRLFTGKGVMPQKVSPEEMREKVKQTEGAIGYLPANLVTEGVKVVNFLKVN